VDDASQQFDENWPQALLSRAWQRLAESQPTYHAVSTANLSAWMVREGTSDTRQRARGRCLCTLLNGLSASRLRYACLIPGEMRIILLPGVGLANGGARRDVPMDLIEGK